MSALGFSVVSFFPGALSRLQAATDIVGRTAALRDMDSAWTCLSDYLHWAGEQDPEVKGRCAQLHSDLCKLTVPFEEAQGTFVSYEIPAHHADNLPHVIGALSSWVEGELHGSTSDDESLTEEDEYETELEDLNDRMLDWSIFVAELKQLQSKIESLQQSADATGRSFGEVWIEYADQSWAAFNHALAVDRIQYDDASERGDTAGSSDLKEVDPRSLAGKSLSGVPTRFDVDQPDEGISDMSE